LNHDTTLLADALNSQNVENTITLYPGAGHTFVKIDTYNKGGAPEQARKQMVGFLKENLRK
jgi:dienelactone hydrolase